MGLSSIAKSITGSITGGVNFSSGGSSGGIAGSLTGGIAGSLTGGTAGSLTGGITGGLGLDNLQNQLSSLAGSGSGISGDSFLNNIGGSNPSGFFDTASRLSNPSSSGGLDTSKIKDPEQRELLEMQKEMQKQNQIMTMLTQIAQIQHDSKKAVLQNFRV
jgi:hypothetical protein